MPRIFSRFERDGDFAALGTDDIAGGDQEVSSFEPAVWQAEVREEVRAVGMRLWHVTTHECRVLLADGTLGKTGERLAVLERDQGNTVVETTKDGRVAIRPDGREAFAVGLDGATQLQPGVEVRTIPGRRLAFVFEDGGASPIEVGEDEVRILDLGLRQMRTYGTDFLVLTEDGYIVELGGGGISAGNVIGFSDAASISSVGPPGAVQFWSGGKRYVQRTPRPEAVNLMNGASRLIMDLFIAFGQSWVAGASGGLVASSTATPAYPYRAFMPDFPTSPLMRADVFNPSQWSGISPFRDGRYAGQSFGTGLWNLEELAAAAGMLVPPGLFWSAGRSQYPLEKLSKGFGLSDNETPDNPADDIDFYERLIASATRTRDLLAEYGIRARAQHMWFVQGVANGSDLGGLSAYLALLKRLRPDVEGDFRRLGLLERDDDLIFHFSSCPTDQQGTPIIAPLAQLELARENDPRCRYIGPDYWIPTTPEDGIHFHHHGNILEGERFAQDVHRWRLGLPPSWCDPHVELLTGPHRFRVTDGRGQALVLDTSTVPDATATGGGLTIKSGFLLEDQGGATITGASIEAGAVVLPLSAAPSPTAVLSYAWKRTGIPGDWSPPRTPMNWNSRSTTGCWGNVRAAGAGIPSRRGIGLTQFDFLPPFRVVVADL